MIINMGMSGMNSPEQTLKELLARLLSVAPSPADSVLRLLAYARLYAAVSRLQAAGAAGRVCPDRRAHDLRAASLVRVLRERLSRSGLPLVDKARLAAAYHDLRSEAFPFRSSGSDEVFPEAVSSLMDRYSSAAEDGVLAEATVCRCLACYFYPDLWDDDEWACLLSGAVRRWASRLRPDGTWPGLTDVEALERVEVMNRYSYLFLDGRFDGAVRRACGRYASLSAFHAPPGEGGGLRCLSLCQDLLQPGIKLFPGNIREGVVNGAAVINFLVGKGRIAMAYHFHDGHAPGCVKNQGIPGHSGKVRMERTRMKFHGLFIRRISQIERRPPFLGRFGRHASHQNNQHCQQQCSHDLHTNASSTA